MNAKRRLGFTLIELLLVIAILITLGTVGVVAYTKIKAGADRDMAQAVVNSTCEAIDMFYTKMGRYPDSEKGLQELCTPPDDEKEKTKWSSAGPFLKDGKIPVDPWTNELKYQLSTTTGSSTDATAGPAYHVWSMGPDKQDGTEDDIRNWTETK